MDDASFYKHSCPSPGRHVRLFPRTLTVELLVGHRVYSCSRFPKGSSHLALPRPGRRGGGAAPEHSSVANNTSDRLPGLT